MSGALPAGLSARLATSAHGWGVVIGGVLNVQTVTDTRKGAALNALVLSGVRMVGGCVDPDCGCTERVLAVALPGARLVPVVVEVRQE